MTTRPNRADGARYAVGLDVGTSAVKAAVLCNDGRSSTYASAGYQSYGTRDGWVEQNPDDWWTAVGEVLDLILADYPHVNGTNTIVGLTGQMHTTVLRGDGGELLRSAILWSDARAGDSAAVLSAEVPTWAAIAGHAPIPAFTSAHLRWVRDNEAEVLARVSRVCVPKDDIRWRLGAGWATEPSDGSAMNLLDSRTDEWSRALLDAVGIEAAVLPPVVASSEVTGTITTLPPMASPKAQRLLGASVIAGAGDQAAQAYALDAVADGRIAISVGTSGAALQAIDRPQLGSFRHCLPEKWLALDSTHAAGVALAWWSSVAGLPLDSIAGTAANLSRTGPLFLPYLQGGRDGHGAPGTLTDLRITHDASDILHAVAEGVGIELVRLVHAIAQHELPQVPVGVGGRAARNPTLRAVLAAGLDRQIEYSDRGPAHGVAELAAVSAGWFDSQTGRGGAHDVTSPDPTLAIRLRERIDRYDHVVAQLS